MEIEDPKNGGWGGDERLKKIGGSGWGYQVEMDDLK